MGIKSSVSLPNSSSGRITSFSSGIAGVSSFLLFWVSVSPVLQLSLPLLQFLSFSLQVVLLSWLLLSYYPVCVLFFRCFSSALVSATASVCGVTATGAVSFTVSAAAAAGCGVLASSFCALSLVAV